MIHPEQLPLDFSPAMDPESTPMAASAQVHQLDKFRAAKEAQRMSKVYAAIFDSIKHIDLERLRRSREIDGRIG